jgi:predicted Zn finger-like uncharacterized protein
MDVRCERCQTEYEIEDAKVTDLGTEVQCSDCGNRFLVQRQAASTAAAPATAASESKAATEWVLETMHGHVHRFQSLTSLQKWIVERRVTRDDKISHDGQPWQRLGEIAEIVPFFDVVDQADRVRVAPVPTAAPASSPALTLPTPMTAEPVFAPVQTASPADSLGGVHLGAYPKAAEIGETAMIRLGASKVRAVLKLMLTMLVAAGVAYAGIVWQQQHLRSAVISSSVSAEEMAGPARARAATIPAAPVAEESSAPGKPAIEPGAATQPNELTDPATDPAIDEAPPTQQTTPEPPELLATQGYAALTHHRYAQAIVLFKRALLASPSNGTALFGLAEAYQATGQKKPALRTYRHYLQILPTGPSSIPARAHIRALESKRP